MLSHTFGNWDMAYQVPRNRGSYAMSTINWEKKVKDLIPKIGPPRRMHGIERTL